MAVHLKGDPKKDVSVAVAMCGNQNPRFVPLSVPATFSDYRYAPAPPENTVPIDIFFVTWNFMAP